MVLILFFISLIHSAESSCLYTPPFKLGSTHRIIQGFNGKYSHLPPLQYGVDFEMPEGTLIYAARGGEVSEVVTHNSESGKTKSYMNKANKIIITHGDGTHSLYAHLKQNSNRVKEKQIIKAGHPIARSGCTGWCEGPHLHFEVFKKKNKLRKSIPFSFVTKSGCSIPELGAQVKNQFIKRP